MKRRKTLIEESSNRSQISSPLGHRTNFLDPLKAIRLRIAFETFVASSTFASSSALVNHQPYASPEPGKLRPKPGRSTQECALKEKCRSVRRCDYVSTAAKHRSKSVEVINFSFSLRDARFLFLVKKIFVRYPKNKIHFFLVDFKTGF